MRLHRTEGAEGERERGHERNYQQAQRDLNASPRKKKDGGLVKRLVFYAGKGLPTWGGQGKREEKGLRKGSGHTCSIFQERKNG